MFMALITLIIAVLDGAAHVLRGMLNYDVQGHFVCKMFMALITFIIAVRDGEVHVMLDGISMWSSVYSVCRRNVFIDNT